MSRVGTFLCPRGYKPFCPQITRIYAILFLLVIN